MVEKLNTLKNMENEILISELRSMSAQELRELEIWDDKSASWISADNSYHLYDGPTGFSSPTNPYAPINAVTVYQSWTQKFLSYVVPPEGWKGTVDDLHAEINRLIETKELREGYVPEIVICKDEIELLTKMVEALQEADIISGWNSEFFDIPYIAERMLLIGGPTFLGQLDHVGVQPPKKEMVNRFGTEEPTYKFTGKSHLDFMRLFMKFTFVGRVSYALGNILEEEVGVGKLYHEETLEELYKTRFPTFVAYNFRDVDGILQLDAKFKFIALVNQMAHESTVLFDAMLGTVSYVETAITNRAHNIHNLIVHDKNIVDHDKVEGAIVLTPKIGLWPWVGSIDMKSQYPNTIISCNISPEKIVGQFPEKEDAWRHIMNRTEKRLTFLFESGEQVVQTAFEWKDFLTENKFCISGYGTAFNQADGLGIVPEIVSFWYDERKRLQAEKKKYGKLAKDEQDPIKKAEYEKLEEDYDLLQLTKKISMNSLYGALLNPSMRFSDERMGASVTATGRQLTTHMMETVSELLTGARSPLIKTSVFNKKKGKMEHNYHSESEAILAGDTDSVAPDTLLETSSGNYTIEDLFLANPEKWEVVGGRQFASGLDVKVLGLQNNKPILLPVDSIYRHKSKKRRFKVTLINGQHCVVTEDHSLMIIRNGEMIEVSPLDISRDTDTCISIGNFK